MNMMVGAAAAVMDPSRARVTSHALFLVSLISAHPWIVQR